MTAGGRDTESVVARRRMESNWPAKPEMSTSLSFSTCWSSTALLHLGEWRDLQRETTTALELARKNGNEQASALCRLTLAWLHVEAMDFDGARALCEGVDEKTLNENQFAYFFQRAVLAKAFVGLCDLQRASKQFNDVQRRLDRMAFRWILQYPRSFITVWGNIACRLPNLIRRENGQSSCATTPPRHPIQNHLALAHGLLARIAFATGDRDEAREHLSRALPIVDNANFPLAAWRVSRGTAEIFESIGQADDAATCRIRFETVIRTLARNFEPDDALHSSVLNTLTT